jgi:ribonuclease BN (tRNA processing enzyme)
MIEAGTTATIMSDNHQATDSITFLGTAGARFMVARQLAASGGIWLSLGGTEILLDPGPGSLVHAAKRKLNPEQLSAIILSHRHLDHSADTNVMVEAMTDGGFKRHGFLYAPADALDEEPVLYSYLRDFVEGIGVLEEGRSYTVGNASFATPLRHIHAVETYGLVFHGRGHSFAYIADTMYFDKLLESYAAADLLIINTVLVEPKPPIKHLALTDAEHIIGRLKPKAAILNHFGMGVWKARPWEVAERMSASTGVNVIAARDGMKFELSRLDEGD